MRANARSRKKNTFQLAVQQSAEQRARPLRATTPPAPEPYKSPCSERDKKLFDFCRIEWKRRTCIVYTRTQIDLAKSFPISLYLLKSASIQPRRSLLKLLGNEGTICQCQRSCNRPEDDFQALVLTSLFFSQLRKTSAQVINQSMTNWFNIDFR